MIEAFKKSDVEILLSTMNRESLDFLVPMFPFTHFSEFNILIINQTTEDKVLTSAHPTVRVLNVFERGLSRSRNLLIANGTKKIGLIADDDLVYLKGFDEHVLKGFNRFNQAAAIKFCTTNFEGIPFRKYPKVPVAHLNAMQRLNSSSIEMALNISIVQKSGILFNTKFGLGSTFPLGEEAIFINDLHNAGYQVSHEPETIVTHKTEKDSDSITLAENYRIRGAYLAKIFGSKFFIWLCIQLAYHIKQGIVTPGNFFSCIQSARRGKQQFLKLTK